MHPMQQQIREYKSQGEMERAIRQMNAQGWQAVSTAVKEQRSGCLRVVMLGGIGALIWRPRPHFLVTFSR